LRRFFAAVSEVAVETAGANEASTAEQEKRLAAIDGEA